MWSMLGRQPVIEGAIAAQWHGLVGSDRSTHVSTFESIHAITETSDIWSVVQLAERNQRLSGAMLLVNMGIGRSEHVKK